MEKEKDYILFNFQETYKKDIYLYAFFFGGISVILIIFSLILIASGIDFLTLLLLIAFGMVELILGLDFIYEFTYAKEARKILISEKQLIIKVPKEPLFQINWKDFSELKIDSQQTLSKIRGYDHYELIFLEEDEGEEKKGEKKVLEIDSLDLIEHLHFKKDKLEELIRVIKRYAKRYKKKIR